jgi:hypothetical protein
LGIFVNVAEDALSFGGGGCDLSCVDAMAIARRGARTATGVMLQAPRRVAE